MKKVPSVILGLLIALSLLGFILSGLPKKESKKRAIQYQIAAYKDSAILEQQNMLRLLDNITATTENPSQWSIVFNQKLNERLAINKRIYAYQWKVDSLTMVLNK